MPISLTSQLLKLGKHPKLFFNHDVQVQYGIESDRQITDFYKQHNLKYYQGLNNFLQTDGERTGAWMEESYNYLQQQFHSAPERILAPQLSLDIPQLTFSQLKEKDKTYFSGGEMKANGTLESFLDFRFCGYYWKISRPWLTQQGATSHLSPHLTFGTISVR